MRGSGGCLTKLVLTAVGAVAFVYAVTVALHPWALHIGGRSTPLLYWHGKGTVVSKDGKTYPLYVMFFPGRSRGMHGAGRREGKVVSARISGTGWLCVAPGTVQRMKLSGTMYGGYTSTDGSLFNFRLRAWRKAFTFNPPPRGFFDLAGSFQGAELVMDRPNEQGSAFESGPFIDHATATLQWAGYEEFEAGCRAGGGGEGR